METNTSLLHSRSMQEGYP
ncbi:hypothetical protein BC936DRAFT_147763 [Jimgerdemannia flammicorona]|uniref:Uncharacterized protein n=1 Tax=Jimgerdemannia flammicorona TaxID=994334 RepID=A0A433DNB1_9FUNG|nr:hypothetical protein BC936DRAFT_147763 [Jimgerdemannia flammicorona]